MGLFIAIDGPNGVGKSTVIEHLARVLTERGHRVVTTREPTDTELGRWIRAQQHRIRGKALACLVTADRYEHLDALVRPAVASGAIVLCDRYICSSLVYQIADGVSSSFVFSINSGIMKADRIFLIRARPSTIAARMKTRSSVTRFESQLSPIREISLYRDAATALRAKGWAVSEHVNNSNVAPLVRRLTTEIEKLFDPQHG